MTLLSLWIGLGFFIGYRIGEKEGFFTGLLAGALWPMWVANMVAEDMLTVISPRLKARREAPDGE